MVKRRKYHRPTLSATEFMKLDPLLRPHYNVRKLTIKELKELGKDKSYAEKMYYVEMISRYRTRQLRESTTKEAKKKYFRYAKRKLTNYEKTEYEKTSNRYKNRFIEKTLDSRKGKYSIGDTGYYLKIFKRNITSKLSEGRYKDIEANFNIIVRKLTDEERYQLMQDLPDNPYYDPVTHKHRASISSTQEQAYLDKVDEILKKYYNELKDDKRLSDADIKNYYE